MNESNSPSTDHISVLSIKTFFLNTFKLLITFFSFVSQSVRRHIVLLLLCSFAGTLLGYIYYSISPFYYKTQMIVQHNELTKKTYYEIVQNLNNLILSKSYTQLASELGIPDSSARKINFMEVLSINNESLVKDTSTQSQQPFKIVAQLSDNKVIGALQAALLKYLNNNYYTTKLKQGRKKVYEQKLVFIEKEMERLDTLKENYNRFLSTSKISATYYNNTFDPADIYRQSANLDNQKENILNWLNNEAEAISVIDGFKTPATPQSRKLRLSLLTGLLVGLATGFLLAFFLSLKKLVQ